jgi:hypothetical protein
MLYCLGDVRYIQRVNPDLYAQVVHHDKFTQRVNLSPSRGVPHGIRELRNSLHIQSG